MLIKFTIRQLKTFSNNIVGMFRMKLNYTHGARSFPTTAGIIPLVLHGKKTLGIVKIINNDKGKKSKKHYI